MAELKNEFTWSFSRQQAFDACRRRYWFRYYAFWGGWERGAPELARKAWFFSKMATVRMVLGTAVHETIADLLRCRRSGRTPQSPFEQVSRRMNDSWLASKEERWRTLGPKKAPPLFEHYYAVPLTAEEKAALKEQGQLCIRNFLESEIHRDLVKAGPDAVRAIDTLEVAELGGVPCFVAPDLAFDRDGQTWLVDWKTGGERADQELQLLAYAEYARQKWRLAPEQLRAVDVMLTTGRQVEVPITAERLAAAAERIRAGAEAMRALTSRELLPPTTDAGECRRCFYREICDERPVEAQAAAQKAS